MKLRRRYLVIPAILALLGSLPIMLVNPNVHGIVWGGLLFCAGVVFYTISQASPHDGHYLTA
jgi:predicted membrane channel-forming protein YqfA (hemolysin III family)